MSSGDQGGIPAQIFHRRSSLTNSAGLRVDGLPLLLVVAYLALRLPVLFLHELHNDEVIFMQFSQLMRQDWREYWWMSVDGRAGAAARRAAAAARRAGERALVPLRDAGERPPLDERTDARPAALQGTRHLHQGLARPGARRVPAGAVHRRTVSA